MTSARRFPLGVPGATTTAGDVEVRAPYDGAFLGSAAAADAETVDVALRNATRLFRDKSAWPPPHRRVEILEKAARILASRSEDLALDAAREGGKPLVDSRVEAARAVDGLKVAVETLRTQAGREVPMGLTAASTQRAAFTRLEPIGVVAAISAFNHPLNLIVHQVAPAVAAGCPVIVKPAEETPLSCLRIVDILREAGLPEGWCQAVVTADVEVAERLATDPRVGFLSFIGSAAVGWMLRSKLAPGTRCALEHGGVAPVIVAADADLDRVVPKIVKGGFYHAGQVCVSVQRVFVARAILAEVTGRLVGAASRLVVGDPALEETEVGPIIRARDLDRISDWVEEAAAAGARIACGGRRIGATCYAPTVIVDPPDSVRVSRLEVFGPVVVVQPYDDLDEAIARANALPTAFQAAVCTRDLDTALRAFRLLDASAVMLNDHTAFRVDWMPFAGLRVSGLGVGGIPHTMREMQVEKMLVLHSPEL
jgi:acyl-CoA reductase-like NAD-dependent aldehyde dehydrogenase